MMSYSNSISTVVSAAYAVIQCFWWTDDECEVGHHHFQPSCRSVTADVFLGGTETEAAKTN